MKTWNPETKTTPNGQSHTIVSTKSQALGEFETKNVTELFAEDGALPAHPATIRFGAGMTVNIGNYQTARVDVSVEMPVDPKNLESMYSKVKRYVAGKVTAEVKEIMESKGGR